MSRNPVAKDLRTPKYRQRVIQNKVWRNANKTWSHHKDAAREWNDPAGCRTDLRFTEEWKR